MAFLFLLVLAVASIWARAASGADLVRGREVYEKRCSWCHGREGMGDGPAARYMMPAPRDFTSGTYKWKSTPFDEYSTSDEDIRATIRGRAHGSQWDGLASTAMPGWSDVLDGAEIDDVVAYIKDLGYLTRTEYPPIDLSTRPAPGSADPELGRRLFKDRCTECHGEEGRGDGTKMLKDDWGGRTWPRDLTKGWTFRMGNSVEQIYSRITIGIPGTQMPSFADPESKKMLSDKERWAVAEYVASLDEPGRRPGASETIRSVRVDSSLPINSGDALWERAPWSSFYLLPQISAEPRHFTPTLDSISVKSLYNGGSIAFLIEWDDPTFGDRASEKLSEGPVFPDAVAVEFPADERKGPGAPVAMGAERGVEVWEWKSAGGTGGTGSVRRYLAHGAGKLKEMGAEGLMAAGVYNRGRWSVVFKRRLPLSKERLFRDGARVSAAFALWDGSNGERGARHVLTAWKSVAVDAGTRPGTILWPLAAALLVVVVEIIWAKGAGAS